MSTTAAAVIVLRTPAAQQELIDRTARLQGKSGHDVPLREAMHEQPGQVLLDQTLFSVTAQQFKAVEASEDAIGLMRAGHGPWPRSPRPH